MPSVSTKLPYWATYDWPERTSYVLPIRLSLYPNFWGVPAENSSFITKTHTVVADFKHKMLCTAFVNATLFPLSRPTLRAEPTHLILSRTHAQVPHCLAHASIVLVCTTPRPLSAVETFFFKLQAIFIDKLIPDRVHAVLPKHLLYKVSCAHRHLQQCDSRIQHTSVVKLENLLAQWFVLGLAFRLPARIYSIIPTAVRFPLLIVRCSIRRLLHTVACISSSIIVYPRKVSCAHTAKSRCIFWLECISPPFRRASPWQRWPSL